MIRRIHIPRFGDEHVLELRSGPPDPLGSGEVRVRVAAAGVNFADLLMRMGLYPEAPPRPFVPGYEVSGTLVDLSPEAAAGRPDLVPGRPVVALTRFGGYASEVVTPAEKVYPLPEGWTFEQGAAFPVTFLTAWVSLVAMARVRAGDRVLVHGVTGGVGTAAVQIARARGARVAGTCGGPVKVDAAKAMGVECAINYRTRHVAAAVSEWAPGGVDVVLESRGGKALRRSLSLLRPTGRVVSYGFSAMAPGRKKNLLHLAEGVVPMLWMSPMKLVDRNIGFFGVNILKLWDQEDLLSEAIRDLGKGIASHGYLPVVDRSFPLDRAGEAHRYLHDHRNIGKVVLVVDHERWAGADPADDSGAGT